jgi:protein tyrosine/serine phosphatase
MKSLRILFRVFSSIALLALAALLCANCAVAQGTSTAAAAPEHVQRLALGGVPNFGRVTPTLYRGGQPTAEGLQELKKLGIEIVVNFRNEPEKIAAERRDAEALGLRYVSIPWSSWRLPDDAQVVQFLELLRTSPDKKVFVHCHHGADRTGVMVAAFRMALERWTAPQALTEMGEFHFHRFWYPHLKSYVEDFPRQLLTNPQFRAL